MTFLLIKKKPHLYLKHKILDRSQTYDRTIPIIDTDNYTATYNTI